MVGLFVLKDGGIYAAFGCDSTKTGKINLVTSSAQLTVNSSSCYTAITTAQVMADGTFETIKTSFNDTHPVTKKYTDQAIKDAIGDAIANVQPVPQIQHAGDRTGRACVLGEFQMIDKDRNITTNWTSVAIKGEDADGNAVMKTAFRIKASAAVR